MTLDLPMIWAALIAFAVLAYVVLDGFDLGVGILFPLIRGEAHRDEAMNSVAPVWDGNETWLVLGGGGLLAVFPLAYSIIMSALYVPIIVMLLALVFRGVAFEFRWRTKRGQFLWDWAFAFGSTLAAFAQGVTLGALVQGIPVEGRAYAGGWWDWLSAFSLLTGVALVIGYALLGATWLIWKTEGHVQRRAYDIAFWVKLAMFHANAATVIPLQVAACRCAPSSHKSPGRETAWRGASGSASAGSSASSAIAGVAGFSAMSTGRPCACMAISTSQSVKRRNRMPPPSKRPGLKVMVPETVPPSPKRSAHPVVVPRSSARTPGRRAGPISLPLMLGGLLASAADMGKVERAMIVS
jgi:hypothetical protein